MQNKFKVEYIFDGTLFFSLDTKLYDCQHGFNRNVSFKEKLQLSHEHSQALVYRIFCHKFILKSMLDVILHAHVKFKILGKMKTNGVYGYVWDAPLTGGKN